MFETNEISDIDAVISDIFCKYLVAFESGSEETAKIYQSFLSDLFLIKTGRSQNQDPAGYLAWWSSLGENGDKRRNSDDRNQKIANLTKYSETIGFSRDGELEEFQIVDNEDLNLIISSDTKAALTVRSQETGESESEIVERLIRKEWIDGATESPTKWQRNFEENIPF